MIYIKRFDEILEALDRSISYTSEEIKNMPEYQDLVSTFNLKDTSSPVIAKSGNIRFQEDGSPQSYTIHTTGAIRSQTLPMGRPGKLIDEKGDSMIDILYGSPIQLKEDYIPKFEYLKKYFQKKMGIPTDPPDSNFVSTRLNDLLSKDPSLAKKPSVLKLYKKGIYIPDEYCKLLIDVGDFGLI